MGPERTLAREARGDGDIVFLLPLLTCCGKTHSYVFLPYSSSLLVLLTPNMWDIFHTASSSQMLCHLLWVLQFNSVLILSVWRQHWIPQVKGSVHDTPPPHPHVRRLSHVHVVPWGSDPPAVNQRFSIPLLGFNSLARVAPELRETVGKKPKSAK